MEEEIEEETKQTNETEEVNTDQSVLEFDPTAFAVDFNGETSS